MVDEKTGAQIIDLFEALKASVERSRVVPRAVGPFACPCGGTPQFEPGYSNGWYCVCECYDGPPAPIGFHATKAGAWINWLWKADAPCVVGWVRYPLKGGV